MSTVPARASAEDELAPELAPEGASEDAPEDAPEDAAEGETCQCCPPSSLECRECLHGPEAAAEITEQMIADSGFAMHFIFDADPPFAYSTGLTETYGLPEIVVVGRFPPGLFETVCRGVDNLARTDPDALRGDAREVLGIAKCYDRDAAGAVDTAFGYVPVAPENLSWDAALPVTRTLGRYGPGGFALRQVVVPDTNRKLPWHEGADRAWFERVGQRALYAPQ